MKKVYRLKENVKNTLMIIAFIAVFTSLLVFGLDRIEKINNGEITQVSESYMDR